MLLLGYPLQWSGSAHWCARSCPKSRFFLGDLGHGLMHGHYMHIQGAFFILYYSSFNFSFKRCSGMVGMGRSTCRSRTTVGLSSQREQLGLIDDTFHITRTTSVIGRSNTIKIQILRGTPEKELGPGNSSCSFSGRLNSQAVPLRKRGRNRNMRRVLFDIQMIFRKSQMQLMKKTGRKSHQD